MNMRPRSLVANTVSTVMTIIIMAGLGCFIYDHRDVLSFASGNGAPQEQLEITHPVSSERIDEQQVENEMNRIAEEKRAAEEKRIAEERRKAEAERKRLADIEQKKREAEKKRLEEIALKKKQEEAKKKKEEEIRQQKLAEAKKKEAAEKKRIEDEKKKIEAQKQKELADKKAAEEKRKAEEAQKAAEAKKAAEAAAKAEAAENDRVANAYLSNASFLGAMQQALYDNWVTGAEMIGYTATVVFYVDAEGNITKIDDKKSKYSGFQPFDESVKAAVLRTKRIKMPDNKHAVNKLVKEGVAVTFDPKDYGFTIY